MRKIAPVGEFKYVDPPFVTSGYHVPAYFGILLIENRDDACFLHPYYYFNPAEFCHGFNSCTYKCTKKTTAANNIELPWCLNALTHSYVNDVIAIANRVRD